jgi:hypothetical protein
VVSACYSPAFLPLLAKLIPFPVMTAALRWLGSLLAGDWLQGGALCPCRLMRGRPPRLAVGHPFDARVFSPLFPRMAFMMATPGLFHL